MDQRPWYQKRKIDPAFPFLFKDNNFHDYTLHWHELLEIVYILKGSVTVTVEGKAYHAVQEDIVVMSPGVIHGFLDASADMVASTYQFGIELFDQTLLDLRERVFQKLVFSRKVYVNSQEDGELHRRLENLLLSIRDEYYTGETGYRLAIRAKLYELALIFLREIPDREPLPGELVKRNYNHQILERVFSFIYTNFCDPRITLEQAAKAAVLSKFYFTRFFKQQTGQTFHTYLSRVRINRAEEYLAESDIPITDIAYLCGFYSLKTFNRVFRTYAGTSPSGYRGSTRGKASTISS